MKKSVNLSELIRRIQFLNTKTDPTQDELEELDFYLAVIDTVNESLLPGCISNLVPISFDICSVEKAKTYAINIGLHIAEGGSGTVYLSWANTQLHK